jgi:indole-3-glycerol phosphate synthase
MILDEIVENTRLELKTRKRNIPLEKVQNMALAEPQPVDLAAALIKAKLGIIAEVKKASPSRGVICPDFNPIEIAQSYAANGASAISILTDNKYFQGSLDFMVNINRSLGPARPPLLRKDFIFDPYQIYESRAYGADALLLIAAILKFDELEELLDLSHQLNMKCLVETHNENEVNLAVKSGARIIGINNRDLRTFKVDFDTTRRLRPLIPADRVVVSESGIKTRSDMENLRCWGVNAALIGESLTASGNIAAKMKELLWPPR